MKKLFNLLMMGALVALVACDPINPTPDPEPKATSFEITVSDITATTATVSVTPSNDTVYYYTGMVEADDLLEYASIEAYADSLLDYLPTYVEWYNGYYGPYYGEITIEDMFMKGLDEYTYEELDPSTKYCVFAFQVDLTELKRVADVTSKEFTTLELKKSENIISFNHNEGDTIINITTTNSDDYFWTYIEKDTLAYYYGGDAAECFAETVEYWADYYGSWFSLLLSSGDEEINTKEFIEKPDTYVFIAANLYDTTINSDVFTAEINVTEDMCGVAEDEEEVTKAVSPRKLLQNNQPKLKKQLRIK